MTTEYTGETIDVTPTWLAIVPALEALLTNSTPEGVAGAREELRKMAGLADAHVASIRNMYAPGKRLSEALDRAPRTAGAMATEAGTDALYELLEAARDVVTRLGF